MKRPLKDVWITTFCIKISPSIQRLVLGRARIQASGFPGRKTMWPSLMTWWQRVNEGSTLYVAAVLRSAMRDAYPSHSYSVVVWHLKCSSLAPRDFPWSGQHPDLCYGTITAILYNSSFLQRPIQSLSYIFFLASSTLGVRHCFNVCSFPTAVGLPSDVTRNPGSLGLSKLYVSGKLRVTSYVRMPVCRFHSIRISPNIR